MARLVTPLVTLACLLALAACSGVSGTGDKGYITGDGRVVEVPPADRGQAIELEGEDLDGDQVALADLRGQPVVVNVWGAWCNPCRAEQPDLTEAANELGEDVAFLGINIRDASPENAQGFVRTFDVPYPSVYSPDSRALLAFEGTLGPRSIPATVVLDREGRVAASIIGSLPSKQTLLDVVERVVDE